VNKDDDRQNERDANSQQRNQHPLVCMIVVHHRVLMLKKRNTCQLFVTVIALFLHTDPPSANGRQIKDSFVFNASSRMRCQMSIFQAS
jgi:hypothetical protein